MKTLNKATTTIFLQLVAILGEDTRTLLTRFDGISLEIELLGTLILPIGKGQWYSFTQWYRRKRHPQMNFIVIDNRQNSNDLNFVQIFPQLYIDEPDDISETGINIEHGKLKNYIEVWQSGHCKIACHWLLALKKNGILKF